MLALQETLGFLITLTVIGSFSFWLGGYFLFHCVKYLLYGPSDQLKSVGHSIVDETPSVTWVNDRAA